MALVGFKNTHNQDVYVNPDQVLYITHFEEGVTIIAMAVTAAGGKPASVYVRGSVELVRSKLDGRGRNTSAPAAALEPAATA
ncbi:MAG: hypothetical protein ACYC10_15540 [Allorhizobium sp.]